MTNFFKKFHTFRKHLKLTEQFVEFLYKQISRLIDIIKILSQIGCKHCL
jgi:hypothetical protein